MILDRFLDRTEFSSLDDFRQNLSFRVPEHFNFGYDVVDAWAAEDPQRRAMLWTDDKGAEHSYTFADLKTLTDRAASFFLQAGIGRGDRVMLILKRRTAFWWAIVALHKIGAVAIPATHLLTRKDIVYRCNAAGIKMIVAAGEADIIGHIEAARADAPGLQTLVSAGPLCPEGWLDFDEGLSSAPAFVRPDFVNDNGDVSLMYFTSGTSGEPKMVAHDFTYPIGHIVTARFWHRLHGDSLHLTVADTGWGKAVWGKLYGQWFVGASVFVYDHEKFAAADILRKMEQYRVTSFCAPPTIYRFMIREDLTKYDLSALEYCTLAGEPLNPSVYEAFRQATGLKPREGFGQTETSMTIGTFPWMEPKPGSMGVPNPAYDMDLMTPDGRIAEEGEQGEIVLHTDRTLFPAHTLVIDGRTWHCGRCNPEGKPYGLFLGYYRDEEKTRGVWDNGLYHTGDIAWRDQDGYFWFVGRTDDVIKSSGYRIGPFEVESALMTHPAVVECAVTGVPDDIRGQVVKATVVLAPDYRDAEPEALIKDIQNHVKRTTAPYKYPRVVEFVDELPKTISGKIKRGQIRREDSQGR